ncbi:hypothetical protein BDV12DRAFT_203465 [Aspergillus spectabilis]
MTTNAIIYVEKGKAEIQDVPIPALRDDYILVKVNAVGLPKYIVAKGDVQIKTPENISDVEAATLGISIATVGQGLYRTLGLPLPTEPLAKSEHEFILIYGGSTATGIFGIQFAKLSGLKVIATASPHNFVYLKSLGADVVFDYRSPTVAADIRAFTNN